MPYEWTFAYRTLFSGSQHLTIRDIGSPVNMCYSFCIVQSYKKEDLSMLWEKMWSDMGQKLKILAQVICVLGMIASLVYAIIIWSAQVPVETTVSYWNNAAHIQKNQPSTFWPGLLMLVAGCILSWVGSWILYGFGLIVERAENGYTISDKGIRLPDGGTMPAIWSTWTCPDCKTENPQSRAVCLNCGKIKSRK